MHIPRHVAQWLGCGFLLLFFACPAMAVMSGYDSEGASSDDPDYVAGLAAVQDEDWPAVVQYMSRLIQRKPWDDQAYNLAGFAYRKLGDYPRSLASYRQALDLNPHHRGALAYLGETYLAMACKTHAVATLHRLAAACKRVMGTDPERWQSECQAWRDLHSAIAAYRAADNAVCELD